jgi:hypothetical protein
MQFYDSNVWSGLSARKFNMCFASFAILAHGTRIHGKKDQIGATPADTKYEPFLDLLAPI